MKTFLILDASNIMYRSFFANKDADEDVTIGMCHHMALMSMNKYYRKYQSDDVILAFDNYSWRKAYTKNPDKCLTYKKYKGTRRQNLTKKEEERLAKFDEHVQEFMNIMKTKTGCIVLERKYLEADDLIAGFIQAAPDDKHILVSSDNDFIQLMRNPNVTIIDPMTDKPKSLADWNFDADYFMFEKCIRGDAGDNVMSSYPRIRKTKIEEAYNDPLAKVNVMNHTFVAEYLDPVSGDLIKKEYKTAEVFEENKLLMDLTAQPPGIRKMINETILDALDNRGKFAYFDFLKFCGKYQLDRILKSMDHLTPLLSGRGSFA